MAKIYPIKEIYAQFNAKNKLVVEDAMNNKFNKEKYKIVFKNIVLNEHKKAVRTMNHFFDVTEIKLICNTIIRENSLRSLFNNTEKAFNIKELTKENLTNEQLQRDVSVYKNLKGSKNNNNVISRVFVIAEGKNGKFLVRFSTHAGRETKSGVIIPISKAIEYSYFILTLNELKALAYEILDYIRYKEMYEFEKYHIAPEKYLNTSQNYVEQSVQHFDKNFNAQFHEDPFKQYFQRDVTFQ